VGTSENIEKGLVLIGKTIIFLIGIGVHVIINERKRKEEIKSRVKP